MKKESRNGVVILYLDLKLSEKFVQACMEITV